MRIVVAPQGKTSDNVGRLLLSWSASGLLRPFVWKTIPLDGGSEPLEIERIARGTRHHESLHIALHDVDPHEVEVVGFYPAAADDAVDTRFQACLLAHLHEFHQVVAPDPQHPLHAGLIVAPAEVGQRVPAGVFSPEWAVNLLVASEDRQHPLAPNELVDQPGDFDGHAAHAIATLADLWHRPGGAAQGVLAELVHLDAGEESTPVYIVRCYARIVDFGYLTGHLAASVFTPGDDGWPNPDAVRFTRDSEEPDYEQIVMTYMEKHRQVLGLSDVPRIDDPEPEALTILEAIKRLFTEILFRLRRLPLEYVERKVIEAHNDLARRLEGLRPDGSTWTIKRLGDADMTVTGGLRESTRFLQSKEVRTSGGPLLDTWTDLRQMTLGMIDGSPLPQKIDFDAFFEDGRRVLISDPTKLVPHPSLRPDETRDYPRPYPCDPLRMDPDLGPSPGHDQDGNEIPIDEPIDRAAWSEGKSGTLLWMIGVRIARKIRQAQAAIADVDEEQEHEKFLAEEKRIAEERKVEEKRDRRRAWFRFLLVTAASLAIGTLGFVLLPVLAGVGICLLLGLFWLNAMVRIARSIIGKREHRILERLRREVQMTNAAIERAYRRGDARRLLRRYAEYLDWAEIVGWLSHAPWIGEELGHVDVASPVDEDTLPAGLRVAVAETHQHLETLTNDAQRTIFRPQWLTGLYEAIEAITESEIRIGLGIGPDQPLDPPAMDTSRGRESPREILRTRIRDGVDRKLANNPLSDRLLTFVNGIAIDRAAPTVSPLDEPEDDGPRVAPLPPATTWFAPPADLADMAAVLRKSVVRISAETPGRPVAGSGVILSADGLMATAGHVVRNSTRTTVTFIDGTSAEAELVAGSETTDLALLRVSGRTMPGVADHAGATVRQGDPVVTLGHPHLQEGEPTLAWGLVTATDRVIRVEGVLGGTGFRVLQATYSSAGGHSGAPVWNLDHKLVGIHTASTGPMKVAADIPEYISSAVPIDDLLDLLDHPGPQPAAASGEAALPRWEDPGAPHHPSPSAFLDGIAADPPRLSIFPGHWTDLDGDPDHVQHVVRSGISWFGGAALQTACGPAAFLRPSRASTSRVEVSKPRPPSFLRSCESQDAP